MFNQVSVPQSELLSLIAAAKSLGVRGLAEEGVNLNARLVEITLLLNSSLLKYLIPQQQKVTTYLSIKLSMEGVIPQQQVGGDHHVVEQEASFQICNF